MEKTKPKIKIDSDKLVRINIIRTNDNRIMVDIKALELLISNHLIKIYNDGKNDDNDPKTYLSVKETLSSINETAVLRIQEQNTTSTRYVNNTIKEIELDSTKLFK